MDNENQQAGETIVDEKEPVVEYKPNRHERRKQAAIARKEQREKLRQQKEKSK
mgnify:CR=1 FL=1